MSKVVKEMMISDIRETLGDVRDFLVVDSSKVTGVEANRLRLALHKQNIQLLGVKNALARKALEQMGISGVDGVFEGPTTLIWGGEDIVALSREITEWANKIKPLAIKGGVVENKALNAKDVESLSKSPGRAELISQVAGLILSPGAQLAAALLGPGGQLAGQLKSLADKEGEGGGEAAPAA